jgi:copper chaperone
MNDPPERKQHMYEFKVQGMTCGSCANTITYALRSIDPKVKVSADIKSQTLRVESSQDQASLSSLIEEAGYAVKSVTSI